MTVLREKMRAKTHFTKKCSAKLPKSLQSHSLWKLQRNPAKRRHLCRIKSKAPYSFSKTLKPISLLNPQWMTRLCHQRGPWSPRPNLKTSTFTAFRPTKHKTDLRTQSNRYHSRTPNWIHLTLISLFRSSRRTSESMRRLTFMSKKNLVGAV